MASRLNATESAQKTQYSAHQAKARGAERDVGRLARRSASAAPAGLYKSNYMVRALAVAVEQRGVHPAGLFEGTALEDAVLDDGLARVSLEDWQKLARRALSLTADSGLGLGLGDDASDHMLKVVGQLALACRSLREAVRMLQRYYLLLDNALQLDLMEEGDLAYFVCTPLRPDPTTLAFEVEMLLSWVYRASRRFAGSDVDHAKEVWLAYSAPPHARCYEKTFRCPVRFNGRHNAILFARPCLDRAQPYADWRMRDILSTAAEQMLREDSSPSLSEQGNRPSVPR